MAFWKRAPTDEEIMRRREYDDINRRQTTALELVAESQRRFTADQAATQVAQQKYWEAKAEQARRLVTFKPTPQQVRSACLSYRHDFGLLPEDERQRVEFEAMEWLRAWSKEWALPVA